MSVAQTRKRGAPFVLPIFGVKKKVVDKLKSMIDDDVR